METSFSTPVVLVNHSQEGKLQVAEGVEVLRSLGRMSIIAVTGPYRSGKSTILNLLTGTQGFRVAEHTSACTKGIWMSCKTTETKSTVVLDIEGFGSTSRSTKQDSKMFALAMLISSMVVYNSLGVIDETSLKKLMLAVYLTEFLNESPQEKIAPKFLWVLRDFVLALEDSEGNPITAAEYLENILHEKVKGRNSEHMQTVRSTLLQCFGERDCVTLPRPVEDEALLRQLGQVPFSEFRTEFQQEFLSLQKKVFNCGVKSIKGKPIKGKELAALLECYVECVNTGSVPDIPSTWEHIVNREYEAIVDSIKANILQVAQTLSDNIPMEESQIFSAFKQETEKAQDLVIGYYLRDEHKINKSLEELFVFFDEELKCLVKQNYQVSLNYNIQLINSLFSPVFQKLDSKSYSNNLDKLEEEWFYAMDTFETNSKGPTKGLAINEFCKTHKDSKPAEILSSIFSEVKSIVEKMKAEESVFEEHLVKASGEELQSEVAFNRFHVKNLNQSFREYQKQFLRQLFEKMHEDVDVKTEFENFKQNQKCDCSLL